MEYLAHSARPDRAIPTQSYAAHVTGVRRLAAVNAVRAGRYSRTWKSLLPAAVAAAAEFHDLGKLDDANQAVLATSARRRLPVAHEDAGVAKLLSDGSATAQLAALLVYCHHAGLYSREAELRKANPLRSAEYFAPGEPVSVRTDTLLSEYLRRHHQKIREKYRTVDIAGGAPGSQLFLRIALSCLVDADHSDTARHYGRHALRRAPGLQPEARLNALDRYIDGLPARGSPERLALRGRIYLACRNSGVEDSIIECDSPVGSGKTTAVMAHLLQAARVKGLRRLFVVLPFTNIIDQSVKVYRKALRLPGETKNDVVAAHHHRAEFEDIDSRELTFLWNSPIVVTTAVQFFQTLAGAGTASLRKLHNLVGAGVFIDEAHACLPTRLWPQTWEWIKQLSEEWGCHFVLGSGSLNRLWTLPEVVESPMVLRNLIDPHVRHASSTAETSRVLYQTRRDPLPLDELVAWVRGFSGPRLVIVNTVQSAAAIARAIAACSEGKRQVEHLSTALTPSDRERTLRRIKRRLKDEADGDWTLVATSCVEAGVDLSFRIGFRERASLTSLLQIGGRVNRDGKLDQATVWDFALVSVGPLRRHPDFDVAAEVLVRFFAQGRVSPENCTEALKAEILAAGKKQLHDALKKAERSHDFPSVEELFQVIQADTRTVVIDRSISTRLDHGERVDPRDLQKHSIQIWASRVDDLALREFARWPALYSWDGRKYDRFIGYMAEVLDLEHALRVACIA